MTDIQARAATTSTDLPEHVRPVLVVHTAFRRELRLASGLVRGVVAGDSARAGVVAAHLDVVLRGLHHHHELEDELVWPRLRERGDGDCRSLIDLMDDQHGRIEQLQARIGRLLPAWSSDADPVFGPELADTLDQLHDALAEHLDIEEREVLPVAARLLPAEEWDAIGRRAEAGNRGPEKALVFGMLAYEGDPAVMASMLAAAPLPARILVPRLARRAYRRHATAVHGTPTP